MTRPSSLITMLACASLMAAMVSGMNPTVLAAGSEGHIEDKIPTEGTGKPAHIEDKSPSKDTGADPSPTEDTGKPALIEDASPTKDTGEPPHIEPDEEIVPELDDVHDDVAPAVTLPIAPLATEQATPVASIPEKSPGEGGH